MTRDHHRLSGPVEAVSAEKLVMVLSYRSHQRATSTHRVRPDAGK